MSKLKPEGTQPGAQRPAGCFLELKNIKKTFGGVKALDDVSSVSYTHLEPLAFDHQGNMDDWLILEKIDDVVQGTSIPYDYSKARF